MSGVWLANGGRTEADEPHAGERLEIGRYPDPEDLVARLFGGSQVVVAFEAGPPPGRIAPLFSVYTGAQREVILLGVHGEDALVRLPYLAATLLLDQPDHRVRGALKGIRPGDPATLTFRRGGEGEAGSGSGSGPGEGGACLQLARAEADTAGACGLRPELGQGWALLMYPSRFPPALQDTLAWAWLLGLGLVPGIFSRSLPGAALGGVGLLLVGGTAPWLLGSTAVLPAAQGLALVAGALLGQWARRGLASCLTP